MTATAATVATKTKQMTEYVVLREQNVAGNPEISATLGHVAVKTIRAASASEAIKQAAGDKEGIYRAIPSRSFKPVKVTVHTETTIRLG